MKRWYAFAGGILVVALGLAISSTGVRGNTLFAEVGKRMAGVRQLPNETVARVNEEGVSLKEVATRRMIMLMNKELAGDHSPVTKKEALQALLRTKVEIAEARKRGLYPTEAEVDRQYKADQEQWAKAPAANRQRRAAAIAEYIKGAGLTRTEYDQIDRKLTGIEMAVTRLRKDFKAKLSGTDEVQKEAAYRTFVDGLVKDAKLEILNEAKLAD